MPKSPCSTCPYRLDAPRRHWHPDNFRDLLAAEGSDLGATYACHGFAAVPDKKRELCAGWLLDQKKRGLPSIKLRLLLATNEKARAALEAVTAGGAKLFRTVKAMCRANGVRRASAPKADQMIRRLP